MSTPTTFLTGKTVFLHKALVARQGISPTWIGTGVGSAVGEGATALF